MSSELHLSNSGLQPTPASEVAPAGLFGLALLLPFKRITPNLWLRIVVLGEVLSTVAYLSSFIP